MPKITKVDKTAVKSIAEAAHQRLQGLAEELGMVVEYEGGNYLPAAGQATVKFSFKLAEIDGVDREQAEWNRLCGEFGLTPEQYKVKVTSRGAAYELVEFELSRSKFPLRARRVGDSKVILFAAEILTQVDREAYYRLVPWARPSQELVAGKKGQV